LAKEKSFEQFINGAVHVPRQRMQVRGTYSKQRDPHLRKP